MGFSYEVRMEGFYERFKSLFRLNKSRKPKSIGSGHGYYSNFAENLPELGTKIYDPLPHNGFGKGHLLEVVRIDEKGLPLLLEGQISRVPIVFVVPVLS